ncbi:MAG: 2-amino-4-hydroxy-6-hydroxymethyldihydropteridine diphosphokinase [Alphaproteobacteria bacterium]
MILIAIGSNLPHPDYGAPSKVCEAAVNAISAADCRIVAVSRWYRSAPLPASDQPDFVNGVISVETDLSPGDLLAKMHEIEADFGRQRSVPNAARILDLDLIAYSDIVMNAGNPPILPHPRLSVRSFVLYPLLDVAPEWIHPVSSTSASDLAAALPPGQDCRPIDLKDERQAV